MTTIAIARPILPHRPSSTLSTPLSLDSGVTSTTPCVGQVPNKHIPICPTGPARPNEPDTPPPSPPSPKSKELLRESSALCPLEDLTRIESGPLSIYSLDASQVAQALDLTARQPLPDPSLVFPWMHGLHPHNHVQQAFFTARKRTLRRIPSCLRAVTVVKADGDLGCARLKGAVSPDEIIQHGNHSEFIEADPREGFSVRNFQIQTAKIACVSDIIVYGKDVDETRKVAWDIAAAQRRWYEKNDGFTMCLPECHTFICTDPFQKFEDKHPEVVSIDSSGLLTGRVLDFFHQERREMWDMTEASEISSNVFLGPTPEPGGSDEQGYDILIECSDMGRLNPLALQIIAESPDEVGKQQFLDFPSSGSILPPTWSHSEADGILETCKWIYHLSHGSYPGEDLATLQTDTEGDTPMSSDYTHTFDVRPRKILLHCADGYTESSMLAIAYFSYSTGRPVPDAWLDLHTNRKRNFFAYPTDVALLTALTPRLLRESPVCAGMSLTEITQLTRNEPSWFGALDGSFPSRILDYMYLGNLGHANNPDLLRALGIKQILSVGETAMWRDGELEEWGPENVCVVQGVQDNGIDPLTEEFTRCLEFIDRGRRNGTATLVHCRVGVSRSATICIAEVMRERNMSFPHAYCFVRARRLNVIIQPHLRFAYELLKWEETLKRSGAGDAGMKRALEWGEITREVALMNRPYSR